MRKPATRLALALSLVALAGCGGNPEPGQQGDQQPDTYVRVDNQASMDMNIYVLRGSQRIRLGTATAHLTSRFRIPPNLIFGITSLRFLADPIGSQRTPVSNEIPVTPGDTVVLTIPPGDTRPGFTRTRR
jgi:hypothetical protein